MTDYVITKEQIESLKYSESILDTEYHDKIIAAVMEHPLEEERNKIIELFDICIQEEGFLVVDQDEPVVLVSDIRNLILALRGDNYGGLCN